MLISQLSKLPSRCNKDTACSSEGKRLAKEAPCKGSASSDLLFGTARDRVRLRPYQENLFPLRVSDIKLLYLTGGLAKGFVFIPRMNLFIPA